MRTHFTKDIISNLCILSSTPVGNGGLCLVRASCLKLFDQLSGWLAEAAIQLTTVTWKCMKAFHLVG